MIIGADLDNTLVSLPVISHISREFGYDYTDEDFHDWHFSNLPSIFSKRSKELFRDTKFLCSLNPYPYTKDKIKEWSEKGHEIILITARHSDVRPGTVDMVGKLFPQIKKVLFVDPNASKLDLIFKNQITLWIDDRGEQVEECLKNNVKSVLVSNPATSYNFYMKDVIDGNLQIVESIKDINI